MRTWKSSRGFPSGVRVCPARGRRPGRLVVVGLVKCPGAGSFGEDGPLAGGEDEDVSVRVAGRFVGVANEGVRHALLVVGPLGDFVRVEGSAGGGLGAGPVESVEVEVR